MQAKMQQLWGGSYVLRLINEYPEHVHHCNLCPRDWKCLRWQCQYTHQRLCGGCDQREYGQGPDGAWGKQEEVLLKGDLALVEVAQKTGRTLMAVQRKKSKNDVHDR